jgi:hypothetical protein
MATGYNGKGLQASVRASPRRGVLAPPSYGRHTLEWPCVTSADGLGTCRPIAPFWPTLARFLSRDRWSVFLVTPVTLLRWHRDLVARSWTYPNHGRSAPNALEEEIVELVLRSARENPRWGYLRIVGECRKLGVNVSATAVRKLLRRHRLGPAPRTTGPSWSAFLRAQAAGTLSCDFFHVDTVDAP